MPKVLDTPIRRCRPSEDVVPFSECRNNLSTYIGRVRETHRPVLITQNGHAASYLVDCESMDTPTATITPTIVSSFFILTALEHRHFVV